VPSPGVAEEGDNNQNEHRAFLVVDFAYGDCGKGTVVDFLTRVHRAGLVVRFNGGPQAGHNVVLPDGQHHTFSQFGSGTFVRGVKTLLSRFVLIEPYALFNEAKHLDQVGVGDALDRLLIDERCIVITPAQQAANRLRELARGDAAHGTCGVGVGETMQDLLDVPELIIRAGELRDRATVRRKLQAIANYKADQLRDASAAFRQHPAAMAVTTRDWIDVAVDNYAALADRVAIINAVTANRIICEAGNIIFEGAQGVLLDQDFGFQPHTTWSDTTYHNADVVLDEAGFGGERVRVGVLRSYFTRHGRGPLVTENPDLRHRLLEPHNADAGWQGSFRVGVFDTVAARYAINVVGRVDALAITHLDRLADLPPEICTAYSHPQIDGPVVNAMFHVERDRILGIRTNRPADLSHQEKLTLQLNQCRPLMTGITKDTDGFITSLEHALGVPAGITSSGPTWQSKQIRLSVLRSSNPSTRGAV
jgi:adenylosuccinate synthase